VTSLADLPLRASGKVREIYDVGDELLIVASDRISTYDVVHPTPIPDKGAVLTGLSTFWFERTSEIVPNHVISVTDGVPDEVRGRGMVVRRLEMLSVECVVRGYLSGSGLKDYQRTGAIAGERLPPGLKDSDRLPEPIFTPATKALTGHDENISRAELADRAGRDLARALERSSLELYAFGARTALERGIILADTKMEFGLLNGNLILIDELFTPDSSRFWEVERYRPGEPQPSFDKQFLRDYLEQLGWNKQPPAPALPASVVTGTTDRYLEAWRRLTGQFAVAQ